jgi:broad specificity phosphatase PhoE
MTIATMKYLFLIRHCATLDPDAEALAHPRHDTPLSQRGLDQAERLASFLESIPIDLILTSLFLRAQQTAAILARNRQAPVFPSMALNEYFLRDDGRGVESTEQGLVRSLAFLLPFCPYYEHIAVVAHSSILATLLMSFLNMPFDEGIVAFSHPGTCRTLRYDPAQGDQQWHLIDTFIP